MHHKSHHLHPSTLQSPNIPLILSLFHHSLCPIPLDTCQPSLCRVTELVKRSRRKVEIILSFASRTFICHGDGDGLPLVYQHKNNNTRVRMGYCTSFLMSRGADPGLTFSCQLLSTYRVRIRVRRCRTAIPKNIPI